MDSSRQFDNFDEHAEGYRKTHDNAIKLSGANSHYFSEYKIKEILKHENPEKKYRILDFGCGDGNSSYFIHKHFPNSEIIGIDVSSQSIDIAINKKIPNCQFIAFEGLDLPFENEEFDIVFTSMVFHHISHDLHCRILESIVSKLRIGGRFYIFEHNPLNPLTRKVVNECEFDKDAILLGHRYSRNLVEESGLNDINIYFTIFFPRKTFLAMLIRLEPLFRWCPLGAQYYIRSVK